MKKLNFHFTSNCNMKCKYCFVPQNKNLTNEQISLVIKKICESKIFDYINFVGGEPTTSSLLIPMIRDVKNAGLQVSIVTNGFLFSKMGDNELKELASLLDCIGISIDSFDEDTNRKIGRVAENSVLSRIEYEKLCLKIKEFGCKLKINTVVSRINLNEDFNSFYKTVQPDRIKVFQVLKPNNICTKQPYDNLLISQSEFELFLSRHSSFNIVSENNSDMTSSYYMLGSDGCFFDNLTGKKSDSILSVSVETALNSIVVDENKYQKRYL